MEVARKKKKKQLDPSRYNGQKDSPMVTIVHGLLTVDGAAALALSVHILNLCSLATEVSWSSCIVTVKINHDSC